MIGWIHDDKPFSTCLASYLRTSERIKRVVIVRAHIERAFTSLFLQSLAVNLHYILYILRRQRRRLISCIASVCLSACKEEKWTEELYWVSLFWLSKLPFLSTLSFRRLFFSSSINTQHGARRYRMNALPSPSLQSQSTSPPPTPPHPPSPFTLQGSLCCYCCCSGDL